MAENDTSTYRARSDGLAWREVADEVVMLDLDKSVYLNLNGTGAILWQAMSSESKSVPQLVELLLAEFDVSADQARQDVKAFLLDCQAKNLLEP